MPDPPQVQSSRDAPPHPGMLKPTTRLAPSPTGSLHLGNARTFLVNWALARSSGWRVVLRIEDLDGPRIRPGAAEAIESTLRWLGIDWDEGPIVQSHDLRPYREAIEGLVRSGAVFPCQLSRTQIEAAASAPQAGSHERVYPASLRPASWERVVDQAGTNWRFMAGPGRVEFLDLFAGPQSIAVAQVIGDFIVWTKSGTPAYQLAVVVDDHRQGITHIVRGDDLLDSAARQLLVYRALGIGPEPMHCHLPLVIGADGLRLAKRHGDSRVESYRGAGVAVERVIGLVASWCGVGGRGALRRAMSLEEF
ncbi:MAG: glutamate--tRNA ligase family protein, partial [Phycisphaerales bacterium]